MLPCLYFLSVTLLIYTFLQIDFFDMLELGVWNGEERKNRRYSVRGSVNSYPGLHENKKKQNHQKQRHFFCEN